MIVSPDSFDATLSANDVYQRINTLPFGYLALAKESHYWGRLFGVITGESNEQDWDEFVINECLRDSVWRTLHAVTSEAESSCGFDLSRRFHHVKTGYHFGETLKTKPALEAVNKIPQWRVVDGFDPVPIDPFLLHNITMEQVGSRFIAHLPTSVVDNPNDVILRRSTDYGTYTPDSTRRPKRVGSDWEVTIDNTPTPYNGTDQVDVQSTKYVYVDITPPELLAGETLFPVYPGTNQIIPQAKSPQLMGEGVVRYWFYIYTLVAPEFYNNPTNLVKAEFYKLLQEIEFRAYSEADNFATITVDCQCDNCGGTLRKFRVNLDILNRSYGLINLCVIGEYFDDDGDGIFERYVEGTTSCMDIHSMTNKACGYELEFDYITNPIYLDDTLRFGIPNIIRAIMFRSAAELPMVDCGCWENTDNAVRRGFIARQQETFAKTSTTVFGTTSTTYQYGDLRGQKAYAEIMSKVPRHKFVLL